MFFKNYLICKTNKDISSDINDIGRQGLSLNATMGSMSNFKNLSAGQRVHNYGSKNVQFHCLISIVFEIPMLYILIVDKTCRTTLAAELRWRRGEDKLLILYMYYIFQELYLRHHLIHIFHGIVFNTCCFVIFSRTQTIITIIFVFQFTPITCSLS